MRISESTRTYEVKLPMMNNSNPPVVSVFLPVRNAQDKLQSQVNKVLDVLPDLTARFELLIIDDASTDETHEIAQELALRYTQVKVVRHSGPHGIEEAMQTGLDHCQSDRVLIQSIDEPVDADQIRSVIENDMLPIFSGLDDLPPTIDAASFQAG